MSDRQYHAEDYPEDYDEAMPDDTTAARPRGLLQSPVLRFVLALFVIIVVIIVGVIVVFLSYRASRDKPLKVKVYPGAVIVLDEKMFDGFDHQQYMSLDSLDQIEAFYDGQKGVSCERQYQTVTERPGEEPLREGHIFTRCQIDRSGYGMTQYTTIVIQPARDEAGNSLGQVIIDVQRHWGA